MKEVITFCLGSENLRKILESFGLGEIIFIKSKTEIPSNLANYQKILFLDLPFGLNFDLSYFLRFSPLNSMGLFYQKNDGGPFLILDKNKNVIQKQDPFYFDGFSPSGVFFTDLENLNKIIKGNYSGMLGIPLGRNNNFENHKNLNGALFLDRDGIINHDSGHLYKIDNAILYKEVIDLIKAANTKNMPVIVLTNQSGVGKGKFNKKDVEVLHQFLQEEIRLLGGKIDAWFFAPFHPSQGQGEYRKESLLRKPGPGMALLACESFLIDISKSFMVGDKISDALLLPGLNCIHLKRSYDLSDATFPVCKNYKEIIDIIFGAK